MLRDYYTLIVTEPSPFSRSECVLGTDYLDVALMELHRRLRVETGYRYALYVTDPRDPFLGCVILRAHHGVWRAGWHVEIKSAREIQEQREIASRPCRAFSHSAAAGNPVGVSGGDAAPGRDALCLSPSTISDPRR